MSSIVFTVALLLVMLLSHNAGTSRLPDAVLCVPFTLESVGTDLGCPVENKLCEGAQVRPSKRGER